MLKLGGRLAMSVLSSAFLFKPLFLLLRSLCTALAKLTIFNHITPVTVPSGLLLSFCPCWLQLTKYAFSFFSLLCSKFLNTSFALHAVTGFGRAAFIRILSITRITAVLCTVCVRALSSTATGSSWNHSTRCIAVFAGWCRFFTAPCGSLVIFPLFWARNILRQGFLSSSITVRI